MGSKGVIIAEAVTEEALEHTITGGVVKVSLLGHNEVLQRKATICSYCLGLKITQI